jgi:hypothetical protein
MRAGRVYQREFIHNRPYLSAIPVCPVLIEKIQRSRKKAVVFPRDSTIHTLNTNMHSRDLRWILLPVLCFAAYSQVETQTEENAIKKYGAPSFTRSSGGEKLLYYVAQKHSPDFVLRINAGRVIEQMWSFTKRPLIVAEATVLFEIVRVDDVMSVNGSIELWINEIGWYAPWKKFDQ